MIKHLNKTEKEGRTQTTKCTQTIQISNTNLKTLQNSMVFIFATEIHGQLVGIIGRILLIIKVWGV